MRSSFLLGHEYTDGFIDPTNFSSMTELKKVLFQDAAVTIGGSNQIYNFLNFMPASVEELYLKMEQTSEYFTNLAKNRPRLKVFSHDNCKRDWKLVVGVT